MIASYSAGTRPSISTSRLANRPLTTVHLGFTFAHRLRPRAKHAKEGKHWLSFRPLLKSSRRNASYVSPCFVGTSSSSPSQRSSPSTRWAPSPPRVRRPGSAGFLRYYVPHSLRTPDRRAWHDLPGGGIGL